MKRRNFGLLTSAVALGAGLGFPKGARAAVSAAQAAQLKTTLTPFGSERAGNTDGSIPAWAGGYTQVPSGWASPALMPDLFPGDQPVVTISASNMEQYTDKLAYSVQQMIQRYGQSLVVYPTRRTAAAPQWVYDNIYQNALNAQAAVGGARMGVINAYGGIPFPILSSDPAEAGAEVMQNHCCRWNGLQEVRYGDNFLVQNGQVIEVVDYHKYNIWPYYQKNGSLATFSGWYEEELFHPIAPPNAVGGDILAYQGVNPVLFKDSGWELLTGQGRVRRIPEIEYDVPISSFDGIINYDEAYGFYGALDEYNWNLVGKKEIYIPYNNNKLQFAAFSDVGPHFFNPDIIRWELHRVWIVDAVVAPRRHNVVARRRFYVDEDAWTVALSDEYDAQGNFWRTSQVFLTCRPDLPGSIIQTWATNNVQNDSFAINLGPKLGVPPSQRQQDYITPIPASEFNPQDMAARGAF